MTKFKANKKNIFLLLIGILFSFSASILAYYNIIDSYYTTNNIILTTVVAFISMFYLYIKTISNFWKYTRDNIKTSLFIFLVALIIIQKLYFFKNSDINQWSYEIYWYFFSALAIYYLITLLLVNSINFLKDIIKKMSAWDKKIYLYISIIFTSLIIIFYFFTPKWYTQMDNVYSMDSGFVFSDIMPNSNYYDIRHPILSIFTFPIYVIINTLSDFFVPKNFESIFIAISIQIINIQLLLFEGLLIKLITKSKIVFIIYTFSFSVMIYLFSLEKYQLCLLPLVLYIYTLSEKQNSSSLCAVISIGLMPTSVFAVFMELFSKDNFINKIKKIFKIALVGVLIMICFGRGHLISEGINELNFMRENFGSSDMPISERFIAVTKMLQGIIIPLSSVKNEVYSWDALTETVSLLSIFIIIIAAIGIIKTYKNFFTKICLIWILFSIVLFVFLNWSPYASPLFSIYFTWALIPMLKYGIDFIFVEKLKINKNALYSVFVLSILIVNVLAILDINSFLSI